MGVGPEPAFVDMRQSRTGHIGGGDNSLCVSTNKIFKIFKMHERHTALFDGSSYIIVPSVSELRSLAPQVSSNTIYVSYIN